MSAMPPDYRVVLAELKQRIATTQNRAAVAVNRELVALYWHVGGTIVRRQASAGWGDSVVERLAHDLRQAFPKLEGFSPRNIWRMRAFFLAWSGAVKKLPQAVAERGTGRAAKELPQAVAETPWGHNVVLLERIADPRSRIWYAERVREHGWSRALLEAKLRRRHTPDKAKRQRTSPAHCRRPPQRLHSKR